LAPSLGSDLRFHLKDLTGCWVTAQVISYGLTQYDVEELQAYCDHVCEWQQATGVPGQGPGPHEKCGVRGNVLA